MLIIVLFIILETCKENVQNQGDQTNVNMITWEHYSAIKNVYKEFYSTEYSQVKKVESNIFSIFSTMKKLLNIHT